MSKKTDEGSRPRQYCSPQLRALGDEELVSVLRDGCHDALAILFERHSALVFHIAKTIVKDDGEAEETVQQVFFDLFKAVEQYRSERGAFKTWMLQFAYHRSINRREHLCRKQFYQREELNDTTAGEWISGAQRWDRLAGPETACLVKQVLATLKPRQRQAIELTYFEGRTAEEISALSGETASAVRHHLYRGISSLRAILLKDQGSDSAESKDQRGKEGIFVAYPRAL